MSSIPEVKVLLVIIILILIFSIWVFFKYAEIKERQQKDYESKLIEMLDKIYWKM